jgi:hypothetical protein
MQEQHTGVQLPIHLRKLPMGRLGPSLDLLKLLGREKLIVEAKIKVGIFLLLEEFFAIKSFLLFCNKKQ